MPPSALLNAERPTPELALVDDGLAVAARSALPEVDTLARIELLVRAHRIAASRAAARAEPPAARPAPAPVPARASARRGRRRRSALVAGGLAATAVVSAALVGARVELGGRHVGADTSPTERPPVVQAQPIAPPSKHAAAKPPSAEPKARPRTSSPLVAPKPRSTTQPRRFVWAPVSGAASYRVQFLRGSRVVFDATTTKPEVTVPQSWTLAGSRYMLTPGAYRWNVWPVTTAGRSARAAVQARLVIGR